MVWNQETDERDAGPGADRNETATERLDRNWNALLQELRALETGTQILTGFLLTVAFQPVFSSLNAGDHAVYLVTVSLASLATVLVLTPVALHRGLFRQQRMADVVMWTHQILRLTLVIAGLATTGVAWLVFRIAAGPVAGCLAGGAVLLAVTAAWILLPAWLRRRY